MYLLDEITNIAVNVIDEPLRLINYHIERTVKAVKELKGNAWNMIWTGVLWGIPGAWISVYANIYMKELGVSDVNIGLITAVTLVTQIAMMLLSGYFNDRYGPKKLLMVLDVATWVPSMLLLIFAQNFWYFFLSVVIRNISMISGTSFRCLFVVGVKPHKRSQAFSIMTLIGALAGLTAPVGGMFVKWFDVVLACRVIYSVMFVSALVGMYFRWIELRDPPNAAELSKKAEGRNGFNFKTYYWDVLKNIWKNREIRWFLVFQSAVNIAFTMWNIFWTVYLVDKRGLRLQASEISIIPFINTIVVLVFTALSITLIKPRQFRKIMLSLTLLPVISALIFIVSPAGTMIFVTMALVMNNIWGSFYGPIAESYLLGLMDGKTRARMFSIYLTLQMMVMAPAAALAGVLYSRGPAVLFSIILFIMLVSYVVLYFKFYPRFSGKKAAA